MEEQSFGEGQEQGQLWGVVAVGVVAVGVAGGVVGTFGTDSCLHYVAQVLLSVKGLIDQIETGSYTIHQDTQIDPVACLMHLLALLMEVHRSCMH